jgi:hypothetical protein
VCFCFVLSKSALFSVCFFVFLLIFVFFNFFFIAVVLVCCSLIVRRRWQPCGLLAVDAADVAQEDAVDVLVSLPFVVVVVVVVCGRWLMTFLLLLLLTRYLSGGFWFSVFSCCVPFPGR